jgi:hypothetical protein
MIDLYCAVVVSYYLLPDQVVHVKVCLQYYAVVVVVVVVVVGWLGEMVALV